uniref:GST delta epsilon 1 n=1 Tax=Tigriopus kingsejongensis TaxID=1133412 RepID=A0A1L3THV4_9MAXI|nr:GST delta epsilon 1 [Tigriopus kingsejongensis]
MSLTLYAHPQSPFCRSVSMTLAILAKEHDYKYLDIFAGDQMKPEFLKINPQHNVPTLVEGDFVLNESRAILVYLAQKFGDSGQLFPEDLKGQAKVNQMLYFDATFFWRSVGDVFNPIAFKGEKEINQEGVKKLKETLETFQTFLAATGYVAGTKALTVADLACMATYTSIEATGTHFVNLADFPVAKKWADSCKKQIPEYEEANQKGVDIFAKFFKDRSGF